MSESDWGKENARVPQATKDPASLGAATAAAAQEATAQETGPNLLDPSLARIASLPLSQRAAEFELLHATLSRELESAIGQDPLR